MAFKKNAPPFPASFAALIAGASPGRSRYGKQAPAERNSRQVKESDVRKIIAGDFTAYHLRAGCELNVTTNDLWVMADKDWLDGVDKPPLRMYGSTNHFGRGRSYLWYVARAEHVEEIVEELMGIDVLKRLGDVEDGDEDA